MNVFKVGIWYNAWGGTRARMVEYFYSASKLSDALTAAEKEYPMGTVKSIIEIGVIQPAAPTKEGE